MKERIRVSLERWTRDTDETFQELMVEDINDAICQVAKARGPKRETFTLWLGARRLEIEIRRVQP